MVAGGLWVMIWRRPWRLLGFAAIGLGLALTSYHARPDIYIDREAKVVAVRDKDGKLQAPKSRRASYTLAQWLKADGDSRKPKDASAGEGWRCDAYSCLIMVKGRLLSFIAKPDAIQEDCRHASILVAPMDIRVPCPAPKVILDRGALWERGAAAISIFGGGMAVEAASQERGVRPWAPERRRKETIKLDLDAKPDDDKAEDARE